MGITKKYHGDLAKICVTLLQRAIEPGGRFDSRSALAKHLRIPQAYLNKWLDYGESPGPRYIERILGLLSGADVDSIIMLIDESQTDPTLFRDIVKLYRQGDEGKKRIFRAVARSTVDELLKE